MVEITKDYYDSLVICDVCDGFKTDNETCQNCIQIAKTACLYKYEKKQRREQSGYWQNTGKYKKKDKLKATFKW